MYKVFTVIQKYWMLLIPLVLLSVFIYSIWDRNYYIGGDLIFPLKPQDNMIKSLYLWEEQNGGLSFFKYMLFFWQGCFYIMSLLHIPTDIAIKLFIILLYILGSIFSYLLYLLLFKETKYGSKKFAFLFTSIFLLNPVAMLILIGTVPLYGIPICFFFLVKYLDTKNSFYIIPFSFFLNLSYFPDLPQAKLLIVFILASFFLLIVYKIVRQISFRSLIFPLLMLGILTFLLNAFQLLPFLNDALGEKAVYQDYTNTVTAYNGDADYLSASLLYITRFYNSNLVGKGSLVGQFLGTSYFTIWTFFVLGIAIAAPLLAKEKKEKNIIYTSLLAFVIFIFIAKGANPPFGEVYRWMLTHVFIVKLFRTTATAIIGCVFFYSILVTFTLYQLSQRWKILFYIFLICNILVFYPIYSGKKLDAWIGGSIHQKGIPIPNEYYVMGETLDSLPDDGKILILPLNDGYIVKNWGYSGQSPLPWLTKKPLISNNNTISNAIGSRTHDELCTFTARYNIRYLLQEKDTSTAVFLRNFDFPGTKIIENKYFILHKVNDGCFLPHFSIPKKTIYFSGHLSESKSFPFLSDYDKSSLTHQENALISSVNNVVFEKSPTNTITYFTKNYLNLDLGQDKLITDIFYPNVSISPDSVFYTLILLKEDMKLKNEKIDKRQLLDIQIILAQKRISEIERWGVGNDCWVKSQKRYSDIIEHAINSAVTSGHSHDNLELLFEYVTKNKDKIIDISRNQPFWDKDKVNSWMGVFQRLESHIQQKLNIPDFTTLTYNLDVPHTGEYHAYLLRDDRKAFTDQEQQISLTLNNNPTQNKILLNKNQKNILELGVLSIDSLTKKLQIHFKNSPNYLDNSNWITGEKVNTVNIDNVGLVFAPDQPIGYYISINQIAFKEISNWDSGESYLLKIRHRDGDGAVLHLMIREKKDVYDRYTGMWTSKIGNIIDQNLNTMFEEGESRVLLKADENAVKGWVYLSVTGGTVTVNDISLQKIISPNLFLVNNKNSQQVKESYPKVNFTKINPTKYIVTITNTERSFPLVFSETFDKGWKVFAKKQIPETQHFLANGYANAWTITPNDLGGNKTQELIVEYIPQRIFYQGQILSLISLFGCLGYSLYLFLRKKRYNKEIN
ncbi:hypothetical protein BH11PAT1_BH11PAT1_0110 [soil metagenome]